ncbi:hypothetical protein E4U52_002983 [Claviceps spartinae]|nr:hypothetical protein E4U52_002983 [Claviceps spartinae]
MAAPAECTKCFSSQKGVEGGRFIRVLSDGATLCESHCRFRLFLSLITPTAADKDQLARLKVSKDQ